MTRRRLLLALSALALMVLTSTRIEALEDLGPALSGKTRLTVFSPHPDDETLGASGLIQRVLRKGGKVEVVFMTSGDGFAEGLEKQKHLAHPTAVDFREYGKEREGEAVKALGTLGLKKEDVTFLGFPDAVLSNLIAKYPSANHACTSPFTEMNHPSTLEIVVPNAQYDGHDVIGEIMWELSNFRPNLIATTPSGGQHPDHCATHYFVARALMEMNRKDRTFKPEVLTFLIHYRRWPMDSDAGSYLNPPEGFPDKAHEKEVKWFSLSLSPEEMDTKKKAILQYHSQMLDMGSYMMSFMRPNELFMKEHQKSAREMAQIPWCGKGVPSPGDSTASYN